jgi:UDP-N-acetylbacillosamine transaminase
MGRIFLSPPHMGGDELKYITEAFDSNYIAPVGANLDKFEEQLRNFSKAKYSIAVSSGTSALHLILRYLDINENDEIFASSFTFIGSVTCALYQGAKLTFIDSDMKSWNLDPNLLEDELKKRVKTSKPMPKVLILTHLYGQMADVINIKNICDRFGVILVEDSAESLGATLNEKQSGTFGFAGIYSFNGNKIITTSSGGAIVSDDEKLIKNAKFLSTQAKENFLHYEHKTYGYNYRMSNILASIGKGQMEVLENRIERKREIFEIYKKELKDVAVFMPEIEGSRGNRWLTTLLFKNNKERDLIIDKLNSENIESRPLWKPMHKQPLFKDSQAVVNGVSEELFERGICLPSGTALEDSQVVRISDIIKEALDV